LTLPSSRYAVHVRCRNIIAETLPVVLVAPMLTVMSGIAELERDLIRKRCQAGIARAKAKGTSFGRPQRLDSGERKADQFTRLAPARLVQIGESRGVKEQVKMVASP